MLKRLPAWSVLLALLLLPGAAAFVTNNQLTGSTILRASEIKPIDDDDNTPTNQRNVIVLCQNVSHDVASGIFDVNNLLKGRVDVLARCVTSALWVSNGVRADTTLYLMLSPHNVTVEVRGSRVRSLTPDERTVALYLQRTLWTGGGKDDDGGRMNHTGGRGTCPSNVGNVPAGPGPSKGKNPQSTPMSEEKTLRDARKGREAMIHRIRVAHRGKSPLPGFALHRDDNLQARLDELAASSSPGDADDDGGGGPLVWMLSETGDPLWELLEVQKRKRLSRRAASTTTLILGNQLGYSACDEELLRGTPFVREVSLGSLSLLTSQCSTVAHHYLDRFFELE